MPEGCAIYGVRYTIYFENLLYPAMNLSNLHQRLDLESTHEHINRQVFYRHASRSVSPYLPIIICSARQIRAVAFLQSPLQ
jgi:hypothetical protein